VQSVNNALDCSSEVTLEDAFKTFELFCKEIEIKLG
jgi:hypothetical protein